ncbi:MAG: hypothetical protein K8S97_02715 [Anaerolineae bacterium]|nr:hypothetical protein [Anaerolineae bacterium]
MNSQFHPDEIIRLSEEYTSPRSAIIRAHIVMGVTRYFLERWVPILGTAPATIVNTLRQLNYHTPDEPVMISGNALARETAMSRRHLYTCLDTPSLKAFVRIVPGQRTRAETGKVVQQTNRYFVRMDDPLNPADAEHLLEHLKTLADTPLEAVRKATAQKGRTLWATDVRQATTHFTTPEPISALHVLRYAFPNWKPTDKLERLAFAQAAERLHAHITLGRGDGYVSKIIVPQYFRQRWWKHLGHDLAWSYLWFRGVVFRDLDTNTSSHVCWISSLDEILIIINRPYEWWRRNVEHAKRKNGSAVTDFFKPLASQKGRDPAHPQRVARQFEVRLDLPISPSDRSRYSTLLIDWPEEEELADLDIGQGATLTPPNADENTIANIETNELDPTVHTLETNSLLESEHTTTPTQMNIGVPHISTHTPSQGPAQMNTQKPQGSHTNEHTETAGVSHISTHSSHTFVHRESKHLKQALKKTSITSSSKHLPDPNTATSTNAAAKSYVTPSNKSLNERLAQALKLHPELPLWQVAPFSVWLQESWKAPIQPHSPAWRIANSDQISVHHLVALMLAISADTTVISPPQYLSWIMKQWVINLEEPPVSHWSRWIALAELPIGQWDTEGRREWIELTFADNRILPLGLEALFDTRETEILQDDLPVRDVAWYYKQQEEKDTAAGLNQRVGPRSLAIRDLWRAALGQLRIQLGTDTFVNWVQGAHPISFHDGVLTVQARHAAACKYLTERYNTTIEPMVSSLAQTPITIRYIEPNTNRKDL